MSTPRVSEATQMRKLINATDQLLRDLTAYYRESVTLAAPESDSLVLAAWTLASAIYDAGQHCTYLAITADDINSGKSTLSKAIAAVTDSALIAQPTIAAIQRITQPVVIIDQFDTLITARYADKQNIFGYLASGHTNGYINPIADMRDQRKNIERNPFGPKVLCGTQIENLLDDAVESRAILLRMRRQDRTESEALGPVTDMSKRAASLRNSITVWSNRVKPYMTAYLADRRVIEIAPDRKLFNRDCDIWAPLIGICDLAGIEWGKRIRETAIDLLSDAAEPLLSSAERMDTKLRELMTGARIVVGNYRDGADRPPIPAMDEYASITNESFGWVPGGGRGGRTNWRRKLTQSGRDLPGGSLVIDKGKRSAELRFRAGEFEQIACAMGSKRKAVISAYRQAGRLHASEGRSSIKAAMHYAQSQINLIAIDVSTWFWPDQPEGMPLSVKEIERTLRGEDPDMKEWSK